MNKLELMTKILDQCTSMSDIVKVLKSEKAINQYMAKYNAIYLKNDKYFTVDNENHLILCPIDSVRQNAIGAMRFMYDQVVFEKTATPEQKRAKKARLELDDERMKRTGIFKNV